MDKRTRKEKWLERLIIALLLIVPALFLVVIIYLACIEGPRTFKVVNGDRIERVK